jgi:hypothetical protein
MGSAKEQEANLPTHFRIDTMSSIKLNSFFDPIPLLYVKLQKIANLTIKSHPGIELLSGKIDSYCVLQNFVVREPQANSLPDKHGLCKA